ncbi:PPC domain-containing DNA-binding protein [Caminicella sporogenes]|uniref:PPC domain-containing DNA-binding protein n=1 Tax=Caminicella sporogenes TaxID=166485 RepID=UPI002540135E|nr:PPC domain-containing DNA-binding protein [Caminicella sporogenes]WIF94877.1 DNA-binding protein [Caminicella sporogenes]
MDYKKFGNTYVMRIDRGEEIIETLKKFCIENEINLASVKGIGLVNKAKIGIFDTSKKRYNFIELTGDYEITSLLGNISTMNDEICIHLHINLADHECKTYGGHLDLGIIGVTGELIIEAIDGKVDRAFNEEIGSNLLKFD